jgi:hypothetical protein
VFKCFVNEHDNNCRNCFQVIDRIDSHEKWFWFIVEFNDEFINRDVEFECLFERIDRIRILVRRVESNRHTCSSSTQSEFRLIQKSRVEWSILGLNDQICSTNSAEQAILSEPELWASGCPDSRTGFWVLFVGLSQIEKKCPNSTRRLHYFFEERIENLSRIRESDVNLSLLQLKNDSRRYCLFVKFWSWDDLSLMFYKYVFFFLLINS